MRLHIATLLLLCAGCGPSREEHLAELERQQEEFVQRAPATHSIDALGGTIIGKNFGEWGGEVAFRELDGNGYRLIADNSEGIFAMPFGIIAFTGLAHLGSNHGAVSLISRVPGEQVVATRTIELPGWPCGVARSGNEVTFNVFRGHSGEAGEASRPRYECFALLSPERIEPRLCPHPIPDGCFP